MKRRDFLKLGTAAGLVGSAEMLESVARAEQATPQAQPTPTAGAQVPDTLELADNGALGINGILGSLNPKMDFESVFLNILDVHPAYMLYWSGMVTGVQPKYAEALPLLRQMSGSKQDLDIEEGFFESMTRNASEDGLVYDRALPDRPWNVGVGYGRKDWNEDYANMAGNGRYLVGLTYMYQATGDEIWKRRSKKTAERMLELAITEGDKAWYPNPGLGNDFSYPRVSGWTVKTPPLDPKEGAEGATTFYLYQPLRGFTRYYLLTGDERFLDLSQKFLNVGQNPKFWQGIDGLSPEASYERGHFRGHLHGNLAAVRGVLDYAVVVNNEQLKCWVRDCYEWVRQIGISRLGILAHYLPEGSMEGCALGDLTALAVGLTDAGMGDYWDDVECLARNGLVSAQVSDLDELKRVAEEGKERPQGALWGGMWDLRFSNNNADRGSLPGQEVYDNVLERSRGAFCFLHDARYQDPMCMSCCTANGNQGFYFAWEGIIRRSGNTAAVNMWLNRRSPWLDVWSWLPYEGRVAVQNKGMKQIVVRRPSWAQASEIRVRIDGKTVTPIWAGNRMLFGNLRGNEQIGLEVPVKLDKASYSLGNLNDTHPNGVYACVFKGHTAVKVTRIEAGADPGDKNWYRIFQREAMMANKAPMKPIPAYVHPEKLVRWFNV
jgi:hypothetical protein